MLALVLALGSWPAAALAQERPDPLPEVAAMARAMRYEDCLAAIQSVLDAEHPSAARILRAVELRGIVHVGMGDVARAEQDFAQLVQLDPGFELTGERPSPRVVQLFRRAQGEGPAHPAENLVVAVAAPLIDGGAAAVVARPIALTALTRVVFYARDGDTDIAELEADPGGPPWLADVSVENRAQARRLRVVARGYAPSGELAAVSRESQIVGEEDAAYERVVERERRPRPVRRRPDEDVPLVESGWFLASIGAAVVIATVVIVLVVAGGDNRDPSRADPAEGL